MKLFSIAVLLAATQAAAQTPPSPQQVQIMLQQIDTRRGEEMNRAISCEIDKASLQSRLDEALKEIGELKKEK